MRQLHELMGDKPRNWTRDLSDEEMLETLRKLYNDLGIVPNQKEVEQCEYCWSIVSYTKRFGSFVEAIIKAGMIPRSKKEPLITPNGNRAYSGYEYKFMLVLEQYNINFKKEEFYKKYIKSFKRNYRFDFTLEFDNELFFIEIFGITGNKKYEDKIKVDLNSEGLTISIQDTVIFNSGDAQILDKFDPVLMQISNMLRNLDNDIRISGHTDNVPIKNSKFNSNWDLSYERALNVMNFMIGKGKIGPNKFVIQACGEYKPKYDNSTEDGRAKNRRVEILIVRKYAANATNVTNTTNTTTNTSTNNSK
jgi:flagellar motor protein MotB